MSLPCHVLLLSSHSLPPFTPPTAVFQHWSVMSQSQLPLRASFNCASFDSTYPWAWLVQCFSLLGSIRFRSYNKAVTLVSHTLTLSNAAPFSRLFLGCSGTLAASFWMHPGGCVQLSIHGSVVTHSVTVELCCLPGPFLERSFPVFCNNKLCCVAPSSLGFSCLWVEFLEVG